MAAEDLTRDGANFKKRGVSVAVSELLTGTQIASDGCQPFTLPDKALVTRAVMVTTVVSGDTDTIDLTYAGNVVANEISAETLGIAAGTFDNTKAYSATGGAIVVKDGAAGVTTAYRGYCVVEYVELEKHTGEFTNFTMS